MKLDKNIINVQAVEVVKYYADVNIGLNVYATLRSKRS